MTRLPAHEREEPRIHSSTFSVVAPKARPLGVWPARHELPSPQVKPITGPSVPSNP